MTKEEMIKAAETKERVVLLKESAPGIFDHTAAGIVELRGEALWFIPDGTAAEKVTNPQMFEYETVT